MALKPLYQGAYDLKYWFDTTVEVEGWWDQEYETAGGSAAFTLTVSPATVAVMGQALALRAAYRLSVLPAAVGEVGQTVALRAARQLVVSPATVTLNGQTVDLTAATSGAFTLAVNPATVIVAGQDVTLVTSTDAAGRRKGGGATRKRRGVVVEQRPSSVRTAFELVAEDRPKKKWRAKKQAVPDTSRIVAQLLSDAVASRDVSISNIAPSLPIPNEADLMLARQRREEEEFLLLLMG